MNITEQDWERLKKSFFKAKEEGLYYDEWYDSLSPEDQAIEDELDDRFCTIVAEKSVDGVDSRTHPEMFITKEEGLDILMSE